MNSIGVDFKLKNILVDNKKVKLQIWDTAGQERFRTITTSYYKGAQAIVIVFDLTDKDSFDHLKSWLSDVDKHAKEGVMKVLVGNKSDLTNKRQISEDAAKEFAKKYGMEYIETSAKDSSNVDDLFVRTTKNFMNLSMNNSLKKSMGNFTPGGISLPNTETQPKSKDNCC